MIPPRLETPHRRSPLLFGLLIFVACSVQAQQPVVRNARSVNPWDDPEFQKRIVGAFGINSRVEPLPTPEEESYLSEVIPLIEKEPEQAAASLQEALVRTPEDIAGNVPEVSARFDFILANIRFQQGRLSDAARSFREAIRKFPDYMTAHKQLGIIFVKAGRYPDGIPHLTKAIQLGLTEPAAYGLLGSAYFGTGQFVAAEGAFRNAILLDPALPAWKLGLIQALFSLERYSDVVALAGSMIKEKPDDDKLWLIQANAYVGNKQMLEAAANYELLDGMGKLPANEQNTLAAIYVNEGLLGLAADTYLKAYEKVPDGNVEGPLRAVEILMARDGANEASRLLTRVKESAPSDLPADARHRLMRIEAKIHLSSGRSGEAEHVLKTLIDEDPLDGEARLMLGKYYEELPEPENDKALALYEEAASLESFEAEAKVKSARLLARLQRYEDAIPLLKRAQELKPQDYVADFLEKLEEHVRNRRR
jgi:tetratricopeptide (TPR) repeat protein